MKSQVVVVEDEAELLDLLCDVLSDEGFDVSGVARPDQLAGLTVEDGPDLFLLDLMLPGLSGIELAQQLRDTGFLVTPMIAMSASDLMVGLASESGLFQGVLSKPFELASLLNCVEQYTAGSGE